MVQFMTMLEVKNQIPDSFVEIKNPDDIDDKPVPILKKVYGNNLVVFTSSLAKKAIGKKIIVLEGQHFYDFL